VWTNGGMVLTGKKCGARKKKHVVCTANLIWTAVGLNQGIHSEMLASNWLGNGAFRTARIARLNYTRVHTRGGHVLISWLHFL